MKIRFLTATGCFRSGQVIEVGQPTADMLQWLVTLSAEVVRDEPCESDEREVATVRMGRRGRPRKHAA
jgi:hypothetical protein